MENHIKEKINKLGVPLNKWNVQINYGIKTGYNEAFIINGLKRDELIKKSPTSKNIIRPILRGRDIQKYKANWQDLYIIETFPTLKLDIEQFPAIKEHLLSFGIDRLKQTGDPGARKKTNNKWFETQDSISYRDDFFKQKIIWKRIGSVIRFSYDESGLFCLDSTCFATGSDMKFLVGYLNSTVSRRELLRNAPQTGTGDVITSVQALEPLLIPKVSEEVRYEVSQLVDLYLTAISNNLVDEAKDVDRRIDQLFFQLFNFSPEEINYISSS